MAIAFWGCRKCVGEARPTCPNRAIAYLSSKPFYQLAIAHLSYFAPSKPKSPKFAQLLG
ncbi:MAG: hypothetical protein WBB28_08685 [Crinalium sp.]